MVLLLHFFFFQAEDGIRDWSVTGVQTCALPIFACDRLRRTSTRQPLARVRRLSRMTEGTRPAPRLPPRPPVPERPARGPGDRAPEIGRASCRERGEIAAGAGW